MTKVNTKDFSRAIAGLKRNLSGEKISLAFVAGGLIVAGHAKEKAPFDRGVLRRSIHIGGAPAQTGDFNSSEGYGDIGGMEVSVNRVQVLVGTNLEYAAAQEFGTDHIPAQPYLRPALSDHVSEVADEIKAVLRPMVKR